MATIITINASDNISDSREDLNANFVALNSDKIETSVIDTDTALAADSDAKIPSQKAVKAYIDTSGGANASTIARGIVEEATAAEVLAETAAGATGARLFINPSNPPRGVTKSVTAGATINGATLPVPVYQNKTDNEFYACDANDTAAYKFLGFAVTNGTDGASMSVQFAGIVSGFTGLDEGEKYYVSDTVGTIGTTPGTQEILVGVAISATELLIQKGGRGANGAGSFSSTTTSVITTGFRPSRIRMNGFLVAVATNIYAGMSVGSWVNGVYASAYFDPNDGTPAAVAGTSSSYILNMWDFGTEKFRITITSVTDTGFTISCTETSDGDTMHFCWEAEGEF